MLIIPNDNKYLEKSGKVKKHIKFFYKVNVAKLN
jgi:hypothetical protein